MGFFSFVCECKLKKKSCSLSKQCRPSADTMFCEGYSEYALFAKVRFGYFLLCINQLGQYV